MKALILGGTGLISVGIVKHLLERGADVTVYNRGKREDTLPASVKRIVGDRSNADEFEKTFERSRYDVVVDMICFSAGQAESSVRAFAGRCEHFEFCSTVCTYGSRIPPSVLIEEGFPQQPTGSYGASKLACEWVLQRAASRGAFQLTIFRPSHTYGPGAPLIDQLELEGRAWDRIWHGLPVLCAGDGLGLWQSTHRDDCGRLFAYAALNPKAYGEAFNAVGQTVLTWREYYRRAAAVLDRRARLIFAPAHWILAARPDRFSFLKETTQFHGAYSSAKARECIPEFRTEMVDFETGVAETFADMRRRGAWPDCSKDADYSRLVDSAERTGFQVVDA